MKHFFMEYGKIIVAGALSVLGLMFSTPFAEAVTGSVANFTTGFTRKNVENMDRVTIGLGNGGPAGGGTPVTPPASNPYAAQVASVQKLYDVGEANLTDSDIITVNGVECYVLQADATKAELITVDIYDQRFNATDTGAASEYTYATADIKTYMDNFYTNQLGSDPKILDTTITYRYKGSWGDDFSTYTTGTVSQKVFALDAVEAQANVSKFTWDYTTQMGGNGYAFWVAAGFYTNSIPGTGFICSDSFGKTVRSGGDFNNAIVNDSNAGARPAFWITLE